MFSFLQVFIMIPISSISHNIFLSIEGVFADIDDTISTEGTLTAEAYKSLEMIQAAGLKMIPVTGRSAGWCDHIARMWPVNGIVGENGAFYFFYDHKNKKLIKRFSSQKLTSKKYQNYLHKIATEIINKVPGSALASDQHYRVSDIAIDFCEDVEPLSDIQIKAIVKIMEDRGLTVKVSSIHVNGWLGKYNKLYMTKTLMKECFQVNLDKQKNKFVFIGDSPNDEPMFKFFPHSVGVANIDKFLMSINNKPKFLTKKSFGRGFSEAINAILFARKSLHSLSKNK